MRGAVLLVVLVVFVAVDDAAAWFWGTDEHVPNQPALELSTDLAFFEVGRTLSHDSEVAALALINQLETSQDKCLLRAFARLNTECAAMSADQRARLAIQWLNCQRRSTSLPEIGCSPREDLPACLRRMDKDDFTQYSMFALKLVDVCLFLADDLFRVQVKGAVLDLQKSMTQAREFASSSTEHWLRLQKTVAELEQQRLLSLQSITNATAASLNALSKRHVDLIQRLEQTATSISRQLDSAKDDLASVGQAVATQQDQFALHLSANMDQLDAAIAQLKTSLVDTADGISNQTRTLASALDQIQSTQTSLATMQGQQIDNLAHLDTKLAGMQDRTLGLDKVVDAVVTIAAQVVDILFLGACVLAGLCINEILIVLLGNLMAAASWLLRALALSWAIVEFMTLVHRSQAIGHSRWTFAAAYVLVVFARVLSTFRAQFAFRLFASTPGPSSSKNNLQAASELDENMLIDIIVQMRLNLPGGASAAPMPSRALQALSKPPPHYCLGVDEDGDQILVALDD